MKNRSASNMYNRNRSHSRSSMNRGRYSENRSHRDVADKRVKFQTKFCTLCSYTNHEAVDRCRNMISDRGAIVENVVQISTKCPECLKKGKYLQHPVTLCPWRAPNSILYKRQKE